MQQDCLVDICEAGMREREVMLLYQMNKQAIITVDTPAGVTENERVEEIVKQGTVFGPVLCCINSAKINEMKEKAVTHISPNVYTEALAYVDDILAVGSKEHIEKVGKNLLEMEKRKKYAFNNSNGKSHYMVIRIGK